MKHMPIGVTSNASYSALMPTIFRLSLDMSTTIRPSDDLQSKAEFSTIMEIHTLAGVSSNSRQSDIFCGISADPFGMLYFQCLTSCVTARVPVESHVRIFRSQFGSLHRFTSLMPPAPIQNKD